MAAPKPTQASREIAIDTPLGEDVLLLRNASISEQMGRLFQIEADLISETPDINFDDIIGKNVTLRLNLVGNKERYFNGFVSRFVQAENQGNYPHYRAIIVPWLWFLTRTADCRIFQNMTVPDIIQKVFSDHGFSEFFKPGVSGTYRTWDYCVQYRETDFNFVSRLMEQEGIYYFFEHENGKHTLVTADSASAHSEFPDYDTIPFKPKGTAGSSKGDVNLWSVEKEVQTGVYALNAFDFEKPRKDLRTNSNISRTHAASEFEMYDYAGDFVEHADGETYAKIRIEEAQVQHEVVQGEGIARGLCSGSHFTLEEHARDDQNRKYLITAASYYLDGGDFEAVESGKSDFFSCRFTAIPDGQPFRPARITPKPLIQGPQTAIVVGKSGEEIWTDKYGRVKVQFHWDRYGKADENSSCWVRVSHAWAGKKWGAFNVPRIGQEVIIEFLEGDPDHPIITGRVYNGEAMPPYDLPGKATVSTIKSNSSKGGGGFNEIRFEDNKGSENIFVHAEKDQDVRVKNDAKEWIGNDRHLYVKNNQTEHVVVDRNELVDNDHKEKIGNDRSLKVVGKEAKEVGANLSLTVKGDVIEVFKGNHSEDTTSDYYLKADNIVIEGKTNVTVKVGESYIAIESGGIKIGTTGTLELESTGALSAKSSAQSELSAPQTSVSGDSMVTIKGGQVMIN
jgi:type VI secretion system secreted protein VgrG